MKPYACRLFGKKKKQTNKKKQQQKKTTKKQNNKQTKPNLFIYQPTFKSDKFINFNKSIKLPSSSSVCTPDIVGSLEMRGNLDEISNLVSFVHSDAERLFNHCCIESENGFLSFTTEIQQI